MKVVVIVGDSHGNMGILKWVIFGHIHRSTIVFKKGLFT